MLLCLTSLISLPFLRNLSMCECARRHRHSAVIVMQSRRAKGATTATTVPSKLYISELDDDKFDSWSGFVVRVVVLCWYCTRLQYRLIPMSCRQLSSLLHGTATFAALVPTAGSRHRDDIFEFLITIHTELKKDPGVPRLPNLNVRSTEKQRRRSVRSPYRLTPVFDYDLCAHSLSQSPPQSPSNEDAMMASKPTLSSLDQLAESASTPRLCPVRLDVCSCQQSEGTAEEVLHLHSVLVLDARDPAGCRSRLVEKRFTGAK